MAKLLLVVLNITFFVFQGMSADFKPASSFWGNTYSFSGRLCANNITECVNSMAEVVPSTPCELITAPGMDSPDIVPLIVAGSFSGTLMFFVPCIPDFKVSGLPLGRVVKIGTMWVLSGVYLTSNILLGGLYSKAIENQDFVPREVSLDERKSFLLKKIEKYDYGTIVLRRGSSHSRSDQIGFLIAALGPVALLLPPLGCISAKESFRGLCECANIGSEMTRRSRVAPSRALARAEEGYSISRREENISQAINTSNCILLLGIQLGVLAYCLINSLNQPMYYCYDSYMG